MLPMACRQRQSLLAHARHHLLGYGYAEVETPLVETAALFRRSLGLASDIIAKEMYEFPDKNQQQLVLRPENTASILRMVVSEGLMGQKDQKYFYAGPMFRYERPQKGRQRQFHQIGVEFLNSTGLEPDLEVLLCARTLLETLGIRAELTLNSLGDELSRDNWKKAVLEYFSNKAHALSPDSRRRLATNPLRILDSKAPEDQEILAEAPVRASYFTPQANLYLEQICEALTACGVPYRLDPRLVRGLDYYSHIVFEFVASETSELGGPSTVLAGGFYTGLLELIGGEKARHLSFPCRGWAAGLERLVLLAQSQAQVQEQEQAMLAVVSARKTPAERTPVTEDASNAFRVSQYAQAAQLAEELRRAGFAIRLVLTEGSLKKNLRRAAAPPTRAVLLLWDDGHTEITVKNLDTGTQEMVARDGLIAYLRQNYGACLRPGSSGGS